MLRTTCFALFLSAFNPAPPPAPLIVSAAISLTDALQEIETAYGAAGGEPLRFNFAGSNVLARQIVNGAPADLFISADAAQMDYAERAGAIDSRSRRNVLGNRLAIVTPSGRAGSVPDIGSLRHRSIRRIAIGDPAAVPAGTYARQYLQRIGLWTALEPKLLSLVNVRAALTAAESGGVDAAVVYESDAAASTKVDAALVITGPDAPVIVYPAAITARSANRAEAERFLSFLSGPEASEIFRRYRFSVLPDPGPADLLTRDHGPAEPRTYGPTDPR